MDEIQDEIARIKQEQAVFKIKLENIEAKIDSVLELLKSHDDKYVRKAECTILHNDFNGRISKLETSLADHVGQGNKRNSDYIFWLLTAGVMFAIGKLV